jgi:hypothetical protein
MSPTTRVSRLDVSETDRRLPQRDAQIIMMLQPTLSNPSRVLRLGNIFHCYDHQSSTLELGRNKLGFQIKFVP